MKEEEYMMSQNEMNIQSEDVSLFRAALAGKNKKRPPVWLMRQAGRYHSHYQNLKKRYTFMDLCKIPKVAMETTMGPIRDFDFDAAILFSDLLFPLEVMGMGLRYDPGPKLDWHLKTVADVTRLKGGAEKARELMFQAEAMELIRGALPREKGLLGFVGGPLTLFFYACEGSHQGALGNARQGMLDGRYTAFFDELVELLIENMVIQAEGGADTVAILDTCAGEVDPATYREIVVPSLRTVMVGFKERCPDTAVTYYSKKTRADHWGCLADLPIACHGVDWNPSLTEALTYANTRAPWGLQGNFDPNLMLLPASEVEPLLHRFFQEAASLPDSYLDRWVCGLGHGVLQHTPEDNIRMFSRLQREYFGKRGQ